MEVRGINKPAEEKFMKTFFQVDKSYTKQR